MHGVVVLAIFGFCLVLAQAIAARRPLPGGARRARRCRLAGDALSVAERRLRRADPRGGALGARRAAREPAAPCARRGRRARARRRSGIDLRRGREGRRARLGGLGSGRARCRCPSRSPTSGTRTTAGSSSRRTRRPCSGSPGPERGLYWRATTLDQFEADRWLESPIPLSHRGASGRLPVDPLLPERARNRAHLGAAAGRGRGAGGRAPRRRRRSRSRSSRVSSARSSALSGGIVRVSGGLQRGQQYTVWSYAPRPEPAELARVGRRVPRRARPVPRRRQDAGRAVRHAGPRRARRRALRRRALPRALAVRGPLGRGARLRAGRADAVRRRRCDRDVASLDRRLRLRRVAAARRRACRRSRTSSPRAGAATASTSPARCL